MSPAPNPNTPAPAPARRAHAWKTDWGVGAPAAGGDPPGEEAAWRPGEREDTRVASTPSKLTVPNLTVLSPSPSPTRADASAERRPKKTAAIEWFDDDADGDDVYRERSRASSAVTNAAAAAASIAAPFTLERPVATARDIDAASSDSDELEIAVTGRRGKIKRPKTKAAAGAAKPEAAKPEAAKPEAASANAKANASSKPAARTTRRPSVRAASPPPTNGTKESPVNLADDDDDEDEEEEEIVPESPEAAAAPRVPSVEGAVFARRASIRGVHRAGAGAAVSAPSRHTPPARLSPPPPSPPRSPAPSPSPVGFQEPRPERPRAPSADAVVDDEDDFEGYDDLLDDDDDGGGGGGAGGRERGSAREPAGSRAAAASVPPGADWAVPCPAFLARPRHHLSRRGEHVYPRTSPRPSWSRVSTTSGEKVFVSCRDQFEMGGGGGGGGSRARGGDREGRWFREDGMNKFVDAQGEVLTGRAAWRASEKRPRRPLDDDDRAGRGGAPATTDGDEGSAARCLRI